jgi:hypothetical protein
MPDTVWSDHNHGCNGYSASFAKPNGEDCSIKSCSSHYGTSDNEIFRFKRNAQWETSEHGLRLPVAPKMDRQPRGLRWNAMARSLTTTRMEINQRGF